MQLAMMGAAERHRELVADLEAEASGLREAQVMGVRRLAAANHTGLCGDKLAMAFVAPPPRFRRHRVVFKIQQRCWAQTRGCNRAGRIDLSCRRWREFQIWDVGWCF